MLGLAAALCSACATLPPPTLPSALEAEGARIMWVGAHPDDESLAGPILARACVGLGRPCLFLVFNRGGGGECLRREGCFPTLAATRARELKKVAEAYGAELLHYDFYNAPLPMSSFPSREEIAARWEEQGDPAGLVEATIRRFRPTVLLTFDPDHGFTGHPEHQLASRYAFEGARRALMPTRDDPGHRIDYAYHVLNRFWIFRLAGGADPNLPTELFDSHVPCGAPRRWCLDVALENTKFHRTQAGDMGRVRSVRPMFGYLYVRKVSPY